MLDATGSFNKVGSGTETEEEKVNNLDLKFVDNQLSRSSPKQPFGGNNGLVLSWPNDGSMEATSQQERGGQSEHQSGEVKKQQTEDDEDSDKDINTPSDIAIAIAKHSKYLEIQ